MLTVVTSAPDRQYTTTGAVRRALGLTSAETSDDTFIDELITRSSRWADTYVGYPLAAAGYRQTLSGFGTRSLMLDVRNVRAVTGLWDSTDTGAATTLLSSEFKVDKEAGVLERDAGWAWDAPGVPRPFVDPLAASYYAGEEEAPWLCDFVAGFTYDGISTGDDLWSTEHGTTSTGRTLPEDIEEAVLMRTVDAYNGDGDVIERRVGDLQIKFARGNDGLRVDKASDLLARYRSFE